MVESLIEKDWKELKNEMWGIEGEAEKSNILEPSKFVNDWSW